MRRKLWSRRNSLLLISVVVLSMAGAHGLADAAPSPGLPPGCTGGSAAGVLTVDCAGDVSAPIDGSTATAVKITVNGNLLKGAAITGSPGKDTITIKGDVRLGATILGGDGDDTITAYDVGGLFCPDYIGADSYKGGLLGGGAGKDTITIGGGPVDPACAARFPGMTFPTGNVGEKGKVLGGDGDDTIKAGSTGFVKSDQKDPKKSIEALGGTIDGGKGADHIDVGYVAFPHDVGDAPGTGHMISGVYGGEGNDTITIGTAKNVLNSIDGGPGNDTITAKELFSGSLSGGDGDDTLTVTGKPVGGLSRVLGGPGKDHIKVRSLVDTTTIDGGPGDDTTEVGSVNGADQPPSPFVGASVGGGEGNDTITVGSVGMRAQIDGGPGDDTISVNSLNGPGEVDHPWATGDNPFYAKAASVFGDAGNNTITVGQIGHEGTVHSGDGQTVVHVTTLSQNASINAEGTRNTVEVSGDLKDDSVIHGNSSNDIITVKGEVGADAGIFGYNGDDSITVDNNLGTLHGDSVAPIGKLCTTVTTGELQPIIDTQLTPALKDLKPVIDGLKHNPPHLDVPGDYTRLVSSTTTLTPETPDQDAATILRYVTEMIDNNLNYLVDRPDDLGKPADVATIKAVTKKLTGVQKALTTLVNDLDENSCVIPESGKPGNDTLTVRENSGYVIGDGGGNTIKVGTNTKNGSIEGNDADNPSVVGKNTITVDKNDGTVNGGGGGTTCTIGSGAGTTTGCSPPPGH